jgi:hypothetical protein
MVYGAEAVLPTNLQYRSTRVQDYQPDRAEEAQKHAIGLLKESRDTAVIRSARYQQALWYYHTRRVPPPQAFQAGDLVLR